MAQRTITLLIDDLTGEEIVEGAGETVHFALDQQAYTIDLTTTNAQALRTALEAYVNAGSKVARTTAKRPRQGADRGTSEVRRWARAHGWPNLGDRGRIPTDALAAYDAR